MYHKRAGLFLFAMLLCVTTAFAESPTPTYSLQPLVPQSYEYEVVDLGVLSGETSKGVGLNNSGQVVGSGDVLPYGWLHGFIGGSPLLDVGTPDGYLQSHLDAVNDLGQAIGWANSDIYGADGAAYLWEEEVWTPLGILPGFESSRPTDINNAGQIVGWSYGGGYARGWIWQDGILTQLETPEYTSKAKAINESGTMIVGGVNASGTASRFHAAVWANDQVTKIGTLTGSRSGSIANDVNDAGFVVGSKYSTVYSVTTGRAFYWDGDGMVLIPLVVGWGSTFGNAVNESNQIVGDVYGTEFGSDGFIWEDGDVRRLTELVDPSSGWRIIGASDINEAGQIIGTAMLEGGEPHAVLLTPIDESNATNRLQAIKTTGASPTLRRIP